MSNINTEMMNCEKKNHYENTVASTRGVKAVEVYLAAKCVPNTRKETAAAAVSHSIRRYRKIL